MAVFAQAIAAFPDFRPVRVFLSLTNLADHSKAMFSLY